MFKDLLLHLSTASKKTTAADYAIALAGAFDAHLAGIAFAYDPVIAGTDGRHAQ